MRVRQGFVAFVLAFSTISLVSTQYSFGFSVHPRSEEQISYPLRLAAEINWDKSSVKTFGHTFKKHGAGLDKTKKLRDTANTPNASGQKVSQGQWLDDNAAALFLKNLHPTISGDVSTPIPKGLGQVINPDGSIIPATHAVVIFFKNRPGYIFRTAFPFVPGKPDYNADPEPVD
jgi:hypothetical protein